MLGKVSSYLQQKPNEKKSFFFRFQPNCNGTFWAYMSKGVHQGEKNMNERDETHGVISDKKKKTN